MPKHRRYFRITMTVTHDLMETIFELLKNEDAYDFRLMELGPDGQVIPRPQAASPPIVNPLQPAAQQRKNYRDRGWAMKHWPAVAPVFNSLGGASIKYKDMRLIKAIVDSGMSPGSVSSLISAFSEHGLIVRTGQGEYRLP